MTYLAGNRETVFSGEVGFEPTTYGFGDRRSTIEPSSLNLVMYSINKGRGPT